MPPQVVLGWCSGAGTLGGRLGRRDHPMAVGATPPLGKTICAVWSGEVEDESLGP